MKFVSSEKLKKFLTIVFKIDHLFLFFILFFILVISGKVLLDSILISYIYTSIWFYLKRVLIGVPIRVINMFCFLVCIPIVYISIINIVS